MSRILLAALSAGLVIATGSPASAQDEGELRTSILGFYGALAIVDTVTEYCFENDGYQPTYMSAGEGWRIRNLPHLDLADAAATSIGGIDAAERTQVEAQGAETILAAARANADTATYCQNMVQLLESGEMDLNAHFAEQYEIIRAAVGQ